MGQSQGSAAAGLPVIGGDPIDPGMFHSRHRAGGFARIWLMNHPRDERVACADQVYSGYLFHLGSLGRETDLLVSG